MDEQGFDERLSLPENFLTEVDRIAVVWGTLETEVNVAIGKLIGFEADYDIRAMFLLTHSGFQQRLDRYKPI